MNISFGDLLTLLLSTLGGTAVILAVVGFLGRSLIGQWLAKDFKVFEDLVAQAKEAREAVRAMNLEGFKSTLTLALKELEAAKTKELEAFKSTLLVAQKDYDAQLAARVRQIELKLPTYRQLWEVSSHFQSSVKRKYEGEEMRRGAQSLRDWYYKDGSGALLSFHAQSRLQAALKLLDAGNPEESPAITTIFSGLRTQLKQDLGIYNDHDAKSDLATDEVIKAARDGKWYTW